MCTARNVVVVVVWGGGAAGFPYPPKYFPNSVAKPNPICPLRCRTSGQPGSRLDAAQGSIQLFPRRLGKSYLRCPCKPRPPRPRSIESQPRGLSLHASVGDDSADIWCQPGRPRSELSEPSLRGETARMQIRHIRYPKAGYSGRCLKPRDVKVKAVTRTHLSWGLDFVRIGR